jgi:hypothetical protein
MPEQNWTMRGEYMESCNCDYLCPCIYTNPQAGATHDHCTAVMAFRIDAGISGATPLAGLKFALVIRSGKVMADGNWIFAGVVDAAADPAQRRALAAIVGGDAGGPPGLIRQNLVSDFRGVEFKPIDFAVEGHRRRGEPFYIDNTGHPANRRLALARSNATRVEGFGLDLDLSGQGNNGHFAPFSWSA